MVSCDDFLTTSPDMGITDDKLTDLPAMRALVNSAFEVSKNNSEIACIASTIVRDMSVRNKPEWDGYFKHEFAYDIYFSDQYTALGLLNSVAVRDVNAMAGTQNDRDVILGEMHFLRALIYFNLNVHFELPSTGYSVPLVLRPVTVDDRLSCDKAENIRVQIEKDIEQAITLLDGRKTLNVDCVAAKALAARIYFFHRNYDKAFQYADEVIGTRKFTLEQDPSLAFLPGATSTENIYVIPYNSVDKFSPVMNTPKWFQASDSQGALYLNEHSELAKFLDRDDARFKAFFTEQGGVIYANKKYSTDHMDYAFIRLPEMLLTRAESEIMIKGSVTQSAVDDVNLVIDRSLAKNHIDNIPSKEDMLEMIYRERVVEMAIESGDHLNNVKRLKRGIVSLDGKSMVAYEQYADHIASIFPEREMNFHDLNRNK